MTQEERDELFDSLHDRMEAELEEYREKLLKLSPEEIIENAYRYVMYGELMNAVDSFGEDWDDGEDLDDEQLEALAELDYPLDSIFWSMMESEWDSADSLRSCVLEFTEQELSDGE